MSNRFKLSKPAFVLAWILGILLALNALIAVGWLLLALLFSGGSTQPSATTTEPIEENPVTLADYEELAEYAQSLGYSEAGVVLEERYNELGSQKADHLEMTYIIHGENSWESLKERMLQKNSMSCEEADRQLDCVDDGRNVILRKTDTRLMGLFISGPRQ